MSAVRDVASSFSHTESAWERQGAKLKRQLFDRLTRRRLPLFLRAGDLITTYPYLYGAHEPELAALLRACAAEGYDDFLLDIGANIGLTSCQSGQRFKQVHLFEPNPMCCHILEVNAALSLEQGRYTVHSYGLGEQEKVVRLSVPKHNWGGAFVRSENNSYSPDVLASKDGFTSVDAANYFDIEVLLKDGAAVLRELFAKLGSDGATRGAIKVDVEGYEPTVLRAIASALPRDVSVYIYFESWSADFPADEVRSAFGRRLGATYRLSLPEVWQPGASKLSKAMSMLLKSKLQWRLQPSPSDWGGDMVLRIDAGAP